MVSPFFQQQALSYAPEASTRIRESIISTAVSLIT